jgi:tetratricopeptide (TPR) repeat protein
VRAGPARATAVGQLGRLAALGLALASGACAALEPAAPPAPAPVVGQVIAEHRDQAERLEREGSLRRALDEWRVVLTVAPDDAAARQRREALEARIEGEVGQRVLLGREALARGAHLEARRQFLAALALDPGNRTAFDALQTQVRDVRVVVHTVRRGETLVSLAERYYGDRGRAELIAETNQLPASTGPAAGTTLRIPEVPGMPFNAPDLRPPSPEPPEPPEMNPLLAEAREAYERGDLQVALAEVERLVASSPQHAEGIELKKQILYGLGKLHFTQRQWSESYQALSALARLAPTYRDAPALLRQARDRVVQQHYRAGLRLFREEKLEEAIAEWRAVLEVEPDHVATRRNLEQAERLLRGLEQRRRPAPLGPQQ